MSLQNYLNIIKEEHQRQAAKEAQFQRREKDLLAEADNKLQEFAPKIRQILTILKTSFDFGLSIPDFSSEITFSCPEETPTLSIQTDKPADRALCVYTYNDRKQTLLRKSTENGSSDSVSPKDIETFLLEFPRFESHVYKWLDRIAYSHQKKVADELPAPDDSILLDALENKPFYNVKRDPKTGEKTHTCFQYISRSHDGFNGIILNQVRQNGDVFQSHLDFKSVHELYRSVVCLPMKEISEDTPCGKYLDMTYEELFSKLTQNQVITM